MQATWIVVAESARARIGELDKNLVEADADTLSREIAMLMD